MSSVIVFSAALLEDSAAALEDSASALEDSASCELDSIVLLSSDVVFSPQLVTATVVNAAAPIVAKTLNPFFILYFFAPFEFSHLIFYIYSSLY